MTLDQSVELFMAGRLDEARRVCRKLLDKRADLIEAHVLLAEIHRQAGDDGRAHALHVAAFQDAAFGDEKAVRRHARQQRERGVEGDLEGAQVAVVDAQQRCVETQGAVEFVAVVHLDQNRHAQRMGLRFEVDH